MNGGPDTVDPNARRLSPKLIATVFAVLFMGLAAGYYFMLRPGYAPLFSDLRAADASAIVAALEAKEVPHRLADGGSTILVPRDRIDDARVMIAGSDVPSKGAVGFELFNKSDMGLTDFAQKINYQRALQGELERTIMMSDGVERARVHLAMPERSLFRAERSAPKAAVEIVAAPGRRLDEARVAGVQRLVAFAVPDLAPADVVVLDGEGRVLSAAAPLADALSPDAEQRQAVERYYRARARAAVEQTLPGLRFDVQVAAGAPLSRTAPAPAPEGTPGSRDFSIRVVVATSAPLNAEEAGLVREAVAAAVALDAAAGDVLSLQVGAIGAAAPAATAPASGVAVPLSVQPPDAPATWPYWLAILTLAIALLLVLRRRDGGRLSRAEREAFVARLRAGLREDDYASS